MGKCLREWGDEARYKRPSGGGARSGGTTPSKRASSKASRGGGQLRGQAVVVGHVGFDI